MLITEVSVLGFSLTMFIGALAATVGYMNSTRRR